MQTQQVSIYHAGTESQGMYKVELEELKICGGNLFLLSFGAWIEHALSLSPRRIRVFAGEVSCVAPELILSSLVDVPELPEL